MMTEDEGDKMTTKYQAQQLPSCPWDSIGRSPSRSSWVMGCLNCGGAGTWRFLANYGIRMGNICVAARQPAGRMIYHSRDKGSKQWRS